MFCRSVFTNIIIGITNKAPLALVNGAMIMHRRCYLRSLRAMKRVKQVVRNQKQARHSLSKRVRGRWISLTSVTVTS